MNDLSLQLLSNSSLLSQIFTDLSSEYQVYNFIPSCFLTSQDVEFLSSDYISQTSYSQKFLDDYFNFTLDDSLLMVKDELLYLLYDDCEDNSIADAPELLLDKWIQKSGNLQEIVMEVEQYLNGGTIPEFRNMSFGYSKIVS